jgi:preprotein translocase subunit SecF
MVGERSAREFNVRVLDAGDDLDFGITMPTRVVSLLETRYGTGQVLIRQSDYVGPRFSGELARSAFYMILLTMVLILIYIWFRFKLGYAVAAVIALTHDTAILIGFIGFSQMEVVSSTIAAVLTIIGYSLNDTIVIFDRIRENRIIMKDSDFKTIIDASLTQSLSRTIITSLTTLLAAAALYVFAQGAVRNFALALIVGILVGTYSSIFIAAPILLAWSNRQRKNQFKKGLKKDGGEFSIKPAEVPAEAGPRPSGGLLADRSASVNKGGLTLVKDAPSAAEIPQLERKLKKKKKKH